MLCGGAGNDGDGVVGWLFCGDGCVVVGGVADDDSVVRRIFCDGVGCFVVVMAVLLLLVVVVVLVMMVMVLFVGCFVEVVMAVVLLFLVLVLVLWCGLMSAVCCGSVQYGVSNYNVIPVIVWFDVV